MTDSGKLCTDRSKDERVIPADLIVDSTTGKSVKEYYGFVRPSVDYTIPEYRQSVRRLFNEYLVGSWNVEYGDLRSPDYERYGVEYRLPLENRLLVAGPYNRAFLVDWEGGDVEFRLFDMDIPYKIIGFAKIDPEGITYIDSLNWRACGLQQIGNDWLKLTISPNTTQAWHGWCVEYRSQNPVIPIRVRVKHGDSYEEIMRADSVVGYRQAVFRAEVLQLPRNWNKTVEQISTIHMDYYRLRQILNFDERNHKRVESPGN